MKTLFLVLVNLFFLIYNFAYSKEFLDNKGIICEPNHETTINDAMVSGKEFKNESSFLADYGEVFFFSFEIDDNGNTLSKISNHLYKTTDKEIIFYDGYDDYGLKELFKINRVTLKRTDKWADFYDCKVINVVRDYEVYEITKEIHIQLKIKSGKSKKI